MPFATFLDLALTRSQCERTIAEQEITDGVLDLVKADIVTGIALEVVEHSSERGELLAAIHARTVVQSCSVARAVEVLAKPDERGELVVAKVALVAVTIEGSCTSSVRCFAVVLKKVVCEVVVVIALTNGVEHSLAIHVAGVAAGTRLHMLSRCAGRNEGIVAEQAWHIGIVLAIVVGVFVRVVASLDLFYAVVVRFVIVAIVGITVAPDHRIVAVIAMCAGILDMLEGAHHVSISWTVVFSKRKLTCS